MTSFFPKNPFSHVVTINLAKQKKTKKKDKTYQKLRTSSSRNCSLKLIRFLIHVQLRIQRSILIVASRCQIIQGPLNICIENSNCQIHSRGDFFLDIIFMDITSLSLLNGNLPILVKFHQNRIHASKI